MKKRHLFSIALLLAAFAPSRAAAEDWAYTGWYPYVYRFSTGDWIYEPANPPLVWDYTANDWAPNPLGGRSFDLRETFTPFPLQLDMTIDGWEGATMRIRFNIRDVDTSLVSWSSGENSDSGEVYTQYSLDVCTGTLLMLGAFPSGENFALELAFQTATSGTYKMIGLFPFATYTAEVRNHLGTISGPFTIEPMRAD